MGTRMAIISRALSGIGLLKARHFPIVRCKKMLMSLAHCRGGLRSFCNDA